MFAIEQFVKTRPFVYHLTAKENVSRIQRLRRLDSARRLFEAARRPQEVRARRPHKVTVAIRGDSVIIRDQAPLHAGNASLPDEWGFEDFIALLNEHVFFWPGGADGPISYGQRHFARYASEKPAIIRCLTASLLQRNSKLVPLFCAYNSGSPRCSYGAKSPRGPDTFVSCADASFSAGRAVEIVFKGGIALPRSSQVSMAGGAWRGF